MIFSAVNAIEKEKVIRDNHNSKNFFQRLYNEWLYPSNPDYTLTFYVSEYLFMRADMFCEDVSFRIEETFNLDDLAYSLYVDFIQYVQETNNLDALFKQFQAYDTKPYKVIPYQTPDVYKGVIFEEIRGFKKIETKIPHKLVLRGECILRDMLEIYDHEFKVENILEISFYRFMNDYRRGLIQNPIQKIRQYVEEYA